MALSTKHSASGQAARGVAPRSRPRAGGGARTQRYLDPEIIARIGNLQILAKTVVEGFVSGLHRSPFLGRSMDFAEYRSYLPGDDLRQIDWKLYSRSDRYFVKQFEGDTNTNVTVVLDASASMDYAGPDGTAGGISKLEYGKFLAASLGYLAHRQRDRIGLFVVDDGIRAVVPNGAKQLETVLHQLETTEALGSTDLESSLEAIAGGVRRRGIVAVVSDLYLPSERVINAAGKLRLRGLDVVVFHVLHPAEIHLAFDETVEVEDRETGRAMAIEPDALRDRYEQRVRRHVAELGKGLGRVGVDYEMITTDEPLDRGLHRYLASRLWSMKSRN